MEPLMELIFLGIYFHELKNFAKDFANQQMMAKIDSIKIFPYIYKQDSAFKNAK